MKPKAKSWDERERENRIKSGAMTAFIMAVLFILFIIFGFRTPYPPPEEEGILIDFGFDQQGFGELEPDYNLNEIQPAPTEDIPTEVEETLVQDIEETVSLNEDNQTEQAEDIKKDVVETPAEIAPEPVKEEPQIDQSTLFNPDRFNFENNSSNEGNSDGQGNMGVPDGKEDAATYFGDNSFGLGDEGVGHNLRGWSMEIDPSFDHQTDGTILVKITLDNNGNVSSATFYRKGSTIVDPELIKKVVNDVKRAKFSKLNGAEIYDKGGLVKYNLKRS